MEGLALTRRSIGGGCALRRRGGRPRPRAPRAVGSTDGVDVEGLRDRSFEAARIGSEVVWDALDKPRTIETKSSSADLVTQTDKKAEEAILEYLKREFPDHMILGEEGGFTGNPDSPYLWCIDPVDGTTNFAHNFPSFAVSVGCLHRGHAVAGAVVEFTGGPHCWGTRTYGAGRGLGATCNGDPISVSDTATVRDSLVVSGFGSDHGEAWALNMDFFKHYTHVSRGVRRMGSAAVDLCQVALGITETYYEFYLKPWDVCAGVLVVEESGGRVTTMDGRPHTVFDRSMIATNGKIHDEMVGYLAERIEEEIREEDVITRWFVPDGYEVA